MKTSQLIGAALDYAVAKCEGGSVWAPDNADESWSATSGYAPSFMWSQAGPIIERENIWLSHNSVSGIHGAQADADGHYFQTGNTPLIAAMRCYVARKLGDTVDIPEALQ